MCFSETPKISNGQSLENFDVKERELLLGENDYFGSWGGGGGG